MLGIWNLGSGEEWRRVEIAPTIVEGGRRPIKGFSVNDITASRWYYVG
jgi:hypothetical protein